MSPGLFRSPAPRDRNRSIQQRLVGLCLISILPLAMVTIGGGWLLWQSYVRSVESSLLDTAMATSLAVDRDVATVSGKLEAIVASRLIDDRDWAGLHAFMERVASDRPGAVLSLVDPDGQVVIQSDVPPGRPLVNLWTLESSAEQASWQGHRLPLSSQGLTRRVFQTGQPAVSGLYLSLGTPQPTVALSMPVVRDGNVRHALTWSSPSTAVQSFLGGSGRSTLRLELVDAGGRVIAHSGSGSATTGTPAGTEPAATGKGDFFRAHATSDLTGWSLRASEPRSVALARLGPVLGAWLGGLVFVIAGALAASLAFARRIADPLRSLSERALSGGDVGAGPIRSGILEIDTLASQLERAAEAERERHDELERRVEAERRERAASAMADAYRTRSEELRVALDGGQMGTWRLDFRTRRISLDARLCTLWDLDACDGIRPEAGGEIDADTLLSRIHPDDTGPSSVEAYQGSVDETTARPFQVEFRVRIRDGGWRWIASYGNRLRDDSGAVTAMVGVNFDISARREAEQALRDSERRFAEMANSVPLMIWVHDAQGRLEFVNHEYLRFFQVTEEAVRADGWQALVHPDDLEAYGSEFTQALRTGRPFTASCRVLGRGEQWRWIESYGTPRLAENGQVLGMVGASADVTERHEIEREREQLLAAERAARSVAEDNMRLKDEFLATLSHELRSPLAVIVGWGRVLLGRHGGGDPDLARGLQLIINHGMAQSQLISDLLDMSAITAGKLRLDWRPLDLNEVIDETVAGQRPAAQARSVALSFPRDPLPVFVRGDADRLRQVVVNLLSNALKFTQAGGHVEVRVQVGETTASVSVSDDGQGIEPAFLPHLFERFSQARGDAGRRHAGLGLGLAIVRQLVELHGGQLRAHSDGPGRGSIFTVELPLLDAPLLASTPTPSAPAQDGRPIQVLVVEDQEAMRDYLARILGDAGMDVTVAASAAEALQRLGPDGFRPQLLVSDIGMPDVDGYELMQRIRETLGLDASVLPAIAVTAFTRSEDRDRAIKAGFQAHVAKPVQATRLVELARELARVPAADHPPDRVD